jgi:hypothetical protein
MLFPAKAIISKEDLDSRGFHALPRPGSGEDEWQVAAAFDLIMRMSEG